jgi:alkaline phosphatase D
MTMTTPWCPDRRLLLRLGTLGVGALSLPGAAQTIGMRGFTHGVASGEPGPRSVLLWTRYVGGEADTRLTVELSPTADFARIVGGGTVLANADRDHTAKFIADGLSPDSWLFYRFVAPDGSKSITGRTRTLPEGPAAKFDLAVFSCSNLGFGWFNAYAEAATRGNFDLAVHLGDYIYEYAPGVYPARNATIAGRDLQPTREIVALADYRLRHASYRADAALQRLHQVLPMIAQWDDHELTNDAWKDGAENHSPDTEGDWSVRKAAAMRAYHEWMPVSEAPWRSYQIGDLATIALPETRISGRMKQFEYDEIVAGGGDVAARLAAFRDGAWQAADRTLLGTQQEAWLSSLLATSVRSGTRWQVLAQQLVMGTLNSPPEAANWIPPSAPDFIRARFAVSQAAAAAGLPLNLDAWDGYPAARARLFAAAQTAGANLVTLSGDSHNGWAFDHSHDGRAAGVEFAGMSVTSPGFESYVPVPPATVAAALVGANPGLRWADTGRRGYMEVGLTPAAATSTWRMWDSVRTTEARYSAESRQTVRHGSNRLVAS